LLRLVMCSALALGIAAAPAAAQSAPVQPASSDSTVASAQMAPVDSAVSNGVAGAPKPVPLLSVSRFGKDPGQPVPLSPAPHDRGAKFMIIGGAAILVGAVVGGDAGWIISVGGACIGLYGLWIYLN